MKLARLSWAFLGLSLILSGATAHAQATPTPAPKPEPPLTLSLGVVRTELEKSAVSIIGKYLEDLPTMLRASSAKGRPERGNLTPAEYTKALLAWQDRLLAQKHHWLLEVSPDVDLQTGDNDAFDSIVAKVDALYIRHRLGRASDELGIPPDPNAPIPDPVVVAVNRPFYVVPVAFGFEADRRFDNVNALIEAGIRPYDLGRKRFKLGVDYRVGAFVQAGYTFRTGGTASGAKGGAVDESEESSSDAITRLKLAGEAQIPILVRGDRGLRFIGLAEGYVDVLNSALYHRIEATLRFSLSKDRAFDLRYQHGSGAPNFNKGDQFGTYLTVHF